MQGRTLANFFRQIFSCACAIGFIYQVAEILGLFVSDFIALHTNSSSSLFVVGYEPDHHIFASYGPVPLLMMNSWKLLIFGCRSCAQKHILCLTYYINIDNSYS